MTVSFKSMKPDLHRQLYHNTGWYWRRHGDQSNTATADDTNGNQVSDLSDDNTVLEDDPTVITLCTSASIAIIKMGTFEDLDGDQCRSGRDHRIYLRGGEHRNVTLTDVTVTDPLVTVSGGPLASLARSFWYRHVHGLLHDHPGRHRRGHGDQPGHCRGHCAKR